MKYSSSTVRSLKTEKKKTRAFITFDRVGIFGKTNRNSKAKDVGYGITMPDLEFLPF